ncbi:MAG: hypothetical protein V4541_14405 [Bacteroidota bacterium]
MIHILTLTENDFITFQLYDASTNAEKIKARRKSYFLLIAIGLVFIFTGYFQHNTFLFYYAIFCVAVVTFFYYRYLKSKLKRHYTKYVKNTYNGAFNESFQLEITDDLLKTEDKIGESNVKLSEIISITEIPSHFFIKMSTGPSLIVAKSSSPLNQEIATLIERKGIPYVNQLNWKWN